jgi:hypothetical protein
MADDEDYWDDLLAHLRQRVLIPVMGPELSTVAVDGTRRTLTELIAARLVKRYELDVSPASTAFSATSSRRSRTSPAHHCANWQKSPICDFS